VILVKESRMTISTWDSNDARIKWREVIDTAATGDMDVVITRYGKPVVAVIDYEDFLALQEELDDLRAAKRADAVYAAYLRDPSSAPPWDEIRTELISEGKLDARE
jgi:prevent-host-death family protein